MIAREEAIRLVTNLMKLIEDRGRTYPSAPTWALSMVYSPPEASWHGADAEIDVLSNHLIDLLSGNDS